MRRILNEFYYEVHADMSRNYTPHKCDNITMRDIRDYIKHFKGLGYRVTSIHCKFSFLSQATKDMIESYGISSDMLTLDYFDCKLGIKYITVNKYGIRIKPTRYYITTHPFNNLKIHNFDDAISSVRLYLEPLEV